MGCFIGLDVGSLSTETVVLDEAGEVKGWSLIQTGANSTDAAERSLPAGGTAGCVDPLAWARGRGRRPRSRRFRLRHMVIAVRPAALVTQIQR